MNHSVSTTSLRCRRGTARRSSSRWTCCKRRRVYGV